MTLKLYYYSRKNEGFERNSISLTVSFFKKSITQEVGIVLAHSSGSKGGLLFISFMNKKCGIRFYTFKTDYHNKLYVHEPSLLNYPVVFIADKEGQRIMFFYKLPGEKSKYGFVFAFTHQSEHRDEFLMYFSIASKWTGNL